MVNYKSKYGVYKNLDLSFDQGKPKFTEELKKEGSGVLTRIDISANFKEKLGIDYIKFVIPGACNHPSVHKDVKADIVYETGSWIRVKIKKREQPWSWWKTRHCLVLLLRSKNSWNQRNYSVPFNLLELIPRSFLCNKGFNPSSESTGCVNNSEGREIVVAIRQGKVVNKFF